MFVRKVKILTFLFEFCTKYVIIIVIGVDFYGFYELANERRWL